MNKAEVLAQYPHLPTSFSPGIFLAHDPLFQRDHIDAFLFPPPDPDMIEPQRTAVLTIFDCIGQQIENLRKKVEFYQELAACEAWTAMKAIETAKELMGNDWAQQIVIDRKIRQMDPDHSFSGELWNEPMPSLLGREHLK